MAKVNRWYTAIRAQFASDALTTTQILEGMQAAGFQHASKVMRATLGGRLAEMVANGDLVRVGPSTFRLREGA
jgi:hypothetical protein